VPCAVMRRLARVTSAGFGQVEAKSHNEDSMATLEIGKSKLLVTSNARIVSLTRNPSHEWWPSVALLCRLIPVAEGLNSVFNSQMAPYVTGVSNYAWKPVNQRPKESRNMDTVTLQRQLGIDGFFKLRGAMVSHLEREDKGSGYQNRNAEHFGKADRPFF